MGVPGGSPVRVGVVEYRTIWGDCCRVVWGWSGLGRRRRMIGREQFILLLVVEVSSSVGSSV